MSSTIGNKIKVSVFGESHGPAIGMVMDAPPAGLKLDFEEISRELSRRAPGNDPTATKRKEPDIPEFLSGIKDGVTTGAPLAAIIRNTGHHSNDYTELYRKPRPSHADYAANIHFGGFNDLAGGGHFSGRLTAPIVIAGAILKQYLKTKGITIGGHILSIGSKRDLSFDSVEVSEQQLEKLSHMHFPVINLTSEEKMRAEISEATENLDSVGGVLEIAATGLPTGLGGPMFDGVENIISKAVFGIPAVKGIEFGDGFGISSLHGSEANDAMQYKDGKVCCKTNHCGGITGGITNGMPLIFRTALKPTPSISRTQETVDLYDKCNTDLKIKGRHDPCIVLRALPAVEAITAIALSNLLSEEALF